MVDFIIAMGAILLLLSGWILVQQMSRQFALRHPEFGPAKEEGGGCGKSCMCSNGSCKNRQGRPDEEKSISISNQEDRLS
jgi:hypothetical protein